MLILVLHVYKQFTKLAHINLISDCVREYGGPV